MLGAAIIVFREVLEAALIVGIVPAASTGAPRRGFWISTGLAGGVFGTGLVALFAGEIASAAAGMASQAAGYLVQADLLPPLGNAVWDTSAVLTEDSVLGKALHTLIGYVSRPDGVQILIYLATFCAIWLLTRVVGTPMKPRPGALSRRAAMPLIVIFLLGSLGAG